MCRFLNVGHNLHHKRTAVTKLKQKAMIFHREILRSLRERESFMCAKKGEDLNLDKFYKRKTGKLKLFFSGGKKVTFTIRTRGLRYFYFCRPTDAQRLKGFERMTAVSS